MRRFTFCLIVIAATVGCALLLAQDLDAPFSIKIAAYNREQSGNLAESYQFARGEEIVIGIQVVNTTSSVIELIERYPPEYNSEEDGDLDVHVSDVNGKSAVEIPTDPGYEIGKSLRRTVLPKGTFELIDWISQSYDMKRLGSYTVQVQRRIPKYLGGGIVKSNTITINVLPQIDLNGDGIVDCKDIAIIKASFGKRAGQTGFDARADVNVDGVVDVRDLALVSQHLPTGTRCQSN